MLKHVALLTKHSLEDTRVVYIELLMLFLSTWLLNFRLLRFSRTCFSCVVLDPFLLTKVKNFDQKLDEEALYILTCNYCSAELRGVLVDLEVGSIGPED